MSFYKNIGSIYKDIYDVISKCSKNTSRIFHDKIDITLTLVKPDKFTIECGDSEYGVQYEIPIFQDVLNGFYGNILSEIVPRKFNFDFDNDARRNLCYITMYFHLGNPSQKLYSITIYFRYYIRKHLSKYELELDPLEVQLTDSEYNHTKAPGDQLKINKVY